MRSTRQKGNEVELRIQHWLEEAGWLVHRARQSNSRKPVGKERCGGCGGPLKTQWVSLSNDIFGVFDLVALRRGLRPMCIQVTQGSSGSEKRRELGDFLQALPGQGFLPMEPVIMVWDGPTQAAAKKWTVFKWTEFGSAGNGWVREFLTTAEVQRFLAGDADIYTRFARAPAPPRPTKPRLPSLFDELLGTPSSR